MQILINNKKAEVFYDFKANVYIAKSKEIKGLVIEGRDLIKVLYLAKENAKILIKANGE